MFSKKFQSIYFALFLLGLFEMYLWLFQWYFILIPVSALLVAVSVWYSIVDRLFSRNYLYYIITPLFFVLVIFAFLSLNEVSFIQHAVIIIGALLYWLYVENVYLFNFDFKRYHTNSIENVSSYINLITFFLFSVTIYALYILIGLNFLVLMIALIVILTALLLQSFWVANMGAFNIYLYIIVINLIVLEVFWALAFMPTNFYANGFLLTLVYYILWGISKSNLHNILTSKTIKRYLIITLGTALLVILSTSWI